MLFKPLHLPQVVAAHGICHLLGYRHETDEEWDEVKTVSLQFLRDREIIDLIQLVN